MTDAAASLLEALGYTGSQRFVTPANMGALPGGELAFAFRRLAETGAAKGWSTTGGGFRGSYLLQDEPGGPAVPVVCILETESDADAREVHRVVWNQNLTPFVIVVSPTTIRLYPGFAYEHGRDVPLREVATTADTALRVLAAFTAEAIDDGTVWKEWGHAADPMQRADESLLRDLKELDIILQGNYATPREASHGLIGKFVYLYYLRHRDILSNRKLADWSIAPGDLFTPNATLRAFHKVNKELQDWLNGSVFTIGDEALADVTSEQLRLVAGIFCGNAPSGQLRFAFAAYNFSYIPIETLSCVYEQFLHDTGGVGQSRGKSLGAYYTPIPLADYMISELERKRPLRPGMKVLDPSCGSGAFLVQCYRRLIETQIRAEGRPLRKAELRSLLTENIFGIDRDADACRVTELSLILTLLDYVTPPDLEDTNFQLPTLRDRNIFEDDFFRDDGRWRTQLGDVRFDWVVGNPPWSEVKGTPPLEHDHYPVWQWMTAHAADCPTGGKQIAEAFLWKVAEHLDERGVAGLLVPAMTWFKTESVAFRRQFFGTRQVWCLANFANLAYVLFAGRSESPASAVFYRPRTPCQDDTILTFAPFVAEQVANRPERITGRRTTWNIVVNHSDVRDIPVAAAKEGSALTWKLAMWGSARDERLLHRISSRRDSTVQSLCAEASLAIAEGIHLVKRSSRVSVSERRDLVGRRTVNFSRLKKVGRIFSFPPKAMGQVAEAKSFVRNRGGLAGLRVSQPPHLIVDCSRRFAVFSNKFILVPKSQLGISGGTKSSRLLRALSVLLTSDFCLYHQFFTSPKMGIERQIAYPETLKALPIPAEFVAPATHGPLAELHDELQRLSEERFSPLGWQDADEYRFKALLDEVNACVFALLGLRPIERWLVEDFVRLNLELNKGKVTKESMRAPRPEEIALYFDTLRDCLDHFLLTAKGLRHKIEAITSPHGAFFSIAATRANAPFAPTVTEDAAAAPVLSAVRDGLRRRHSQWVYFDRTLKSYERGVFYQFKPMQRLHWSRRQAVLDADEIIAETLEARCDE